jgi:hypothetical protein
MLKPGDKMIEKNTRYMEEWDKKHPDQDWKTGLTELDIDKIERARKGDDARYYKLDNFSVRYGEPLEAKVDGAIKEIPGALALEVIQLGEEITKKEYKNIKYKQ